MKILIADDHELYRDALSILVKRLDSSVDVVATANFSELLSQLEIQNEWTAILIDLNMPDLNYYQGIQQLTSAFPAIPVIAITSSEDPYDTQQALDAGALGYLTKSMPSDDMLNALNLMLDSGISIHPATQSASTESTLLSSQFIQSNLTPRQYQVLKHMCKGESNKRIALNMELSESTVKLHVRAILRVLNVTNRTEAVIKAQHYITME